MESRTVTAAGVFVVLLSSLAPVFGDIMCYSCTSYMSQCKEAVDDSQGGVFKANCNSKCFVRRGEDGAIYRGCYDGFMEVRELQYSYSGCRNQTWNRKSLEWCLCDQNLCNHDMMTMSRAGSGSGRKVSGFHKYDYNDITYNLNEVKLSDYPDVKYQYIDPGYDTPQTPTVNKHASMDRYAREGPDSGYDELLFGLNDQDSGPYKEVKYLSPDTPSYPEQYQLKYYVPGDMATERYSTEDYDTEPYNIPQTYPQQVYYPHRPEYSRESGPEYNYHTPKPYHSYNTPPQAYNTPPPSYNTPPQAYNDGYMEDSANHVSARLASKIRCNKSGYYQNPSDCRQFVACLLDPYSQTPIMHVMKCPHGLVWDNKKKICMEFSTTCNVVVSNHVDSELRDFRSKLDVSGYSSNSVGGANMGEGGVGGVSEQVHGNGPEIGEGLTRHKDGTEMHGDSTDMYQDNPYGTSGDVNREVYSDVTYGLNQPAHG